MWEKLSPKVAGVWTMKIRIKGLISQETDPVDA
jgi:hypothetical protein